MKKSKRKDIKILIVSPLPDQSYELAAWPVETAPIILEAKVLQDGVDISRKIKIEWKLRLSWQATHKTYETKIEASGNPARVKMQTGGLLRVRGAVTIDGAEYSARIKIRIRGKNPDRKQLEKELDSDLLKAIAWQESTWRQFDSEGEPIMPIVPKGQRVPAMRGLFQISEWWWGRDKRITHQDYNRVAWQWVYNVATAREILNLLHKIVLARYPDESEKRQWDRTIKAFTVGESSINTKQAPDDFWYVVKVRKYLREKGWGK